MTKRPLAEMLSDAGSVKQKRPNDGVVLPDDVGELCSYLDDGELVEEDMIFSPDEHLKRGKQKVQALKAEKQALRRDLSRSRRVGRTLEIDIGRLRRQRHREISYERRAQWDIHARENALTSREQACDSLQETLLNLKVHLEKETRLCEQKEVNQVIEQLVDRVEMSTTMIDLQETQEELLGSKILENEWDDYAARVENERHEMEEFGAVEQQLLTEQVDSLRTELERTQRRLREEEEAGTNLLNTCDSLKQEVTCHSQWLTGFAINSMAMVKLQELMATRLVAEREEWQQNSSQWQQERDEIIAEQSKKLDNFEGANAELREQLAVSQLNQLNVENQLQTSQKTAKSLEAKKKKLQTELKILRDQFKTLQDEHRGGER